MASYTSFSSNPLDSSRRLTKQEQQKQQKQALQKQAQQMFAKNTDEECISANFGNNLLKSKCLEYYGIQIPKTEENTEKRGKISVKMKTQNTDVYTDLNKWIDDVVERLNAQKNFIIDDRVANPGIIRRVKKMFQSITLSSKKARAKLEKIWDDKQDDLHRRIRHEIEKNNFDDLNGSITGAGTYKNMIKTILMDIIFNAFIAWLKEHEIITPNRIDLIQKQKQDDDCEILSKKLASYTEVNRTSLRNHICTSLTTTMIESFKQLIPKLKSFKVQNDLALKQCDRMVKLFHSFDNSKKTREILELLSAYYKIPHGDTTGRDLYKKMMIKRKSDPTAISPFNLLHSCSA